MKKSLKLIIQKSNCEKKAKKKKRCKQKLNFPYYFVIQAMLTERFLDNIQ